MSVISSRGFRVCLVRSNWSFAIVCFCLTTRQKRSLHPSAPPSVNKWALTLKPNLSFWGLLGNNIPKRQQKQQLPIGFWGTFTSFASDALIKMDFVVQLHGPSSAKYALIKTAPSSLDVYSTAWLKLMSPHMEAEHVKCEDWNKIVIIFLAIRFYFLS